jgi:hypothetical protein
MESFHRTILLKIFDHKQLELMLEREAIHYIQEILMCQKKDNLQAELEELRVVL